MLVDHELTTEQVDETAIIINELSAPGVGSLAIWAQIARAAEALHTWTQDQQRLTSNSAQAADLDTLMEAAGCEQWTWHAVRLVDGRLYAVCRIGQGVAWAYPVVGVVDLKRTQVRVMTTQTTDRLALEQLPLPERRAQGSKRPTLGQLYHAAFIEACPVRFGWPGWDEQSEWFQRATEAAADAVAMAVLQRVDPGTPRCPWDADAEEARAEAEFERSALEATS